MRMILTAFAFGLLATPASLSGQEVRGVLLDRESALAIEAGTVSLLTEDSVPVASVATGADGAFALSAPGPGLYRLAAERIGYRGSATEPIELAIGDTLQVEYRLSTEAVVLQPLTVVAYSGRPDGPLGGFYQRMERGFGTFITREEIDERRPVYASDLLRGIPGVQLVPTWWGRTVVLMRGRCVPQIYLDGVRMHGAGVDDLVHPMDLEGIEVYRGPAELPAEFSGPGAACGAIVLWTRRGS